MRKSPALRVTKEHKKIKAHSGYKHSMTTRESTHVHNHICCMNDNKRALSRCHSNDGCHESKEELQREDLEYKIKINNNL